MAIRSHFESPYKDTDDRTEILRRGLWQDQSDVCWELPKMKGIYVKMSLDMIALTKILARMKGVGYQHLMKEWLAERIRKERAVALKHIDQGVPDVLRPTSKRRMVRPMKGTVGAARKGG